MIEQSRFLTISGDASEARKTSEEKELVFSKILATGFKGVVPITVLLKCQSLKDFGGGTSKGTLDAMLNALSLYASQEVIFKKIICAVADGAAVNFGRHSGALVILSELVGWNLPTIHCMNHKLELAMKDSYSDDRTFTDIKDMLDVLFRLFKNSGRTWRMYQLVAESLNLVPIRFTRVGGTRFQAHTLSALSSFLRNFVVTVLFGENVEEHGSGKGSLVTKEMYPRIIGFRKKWSKLQFLASANMFFRVLNETGHLSLLMEADTAMIYQLHNAVEDAISNLNDIANEEDTKLFPPNVKIIKETHESENFLMADSVTISVAASNVPQKKLQEIRAARETGLRPDQEVTVVKENFVLYNAQKGREKVEEIKSNLIPNIIGNLRSRFENLSSCEEFNAFQLFDVTKWNDGEDTEALIKFDNDRIDVIAQRFVSLLTINNFDVKEAKKEWKKVIYYVFTCSC